MPLRRVFLIERHKAAHEDGRTLQFFVRPGSRSRAWNWFKLGEVPEFEGDAARFECERIKGEWKVTENGKRAKFYSLTRPGRRLLEREAATWERLSGAITHVVRVGAA